MVYKKLSWNTVLTDHCDVRYKPAVTSVVRGHTEVRTKQAQGQIPDL